jgi:hypothetical protein
LKKTALETLFVISHCHWTTKQVAVHSKPQILENYITEQDTTQMSDRPLIHRVSLSSACDIHIRILMLGFFLFV